jgi:hypothetical protein
MRRCVVPALALAAFATGAGVGDASSVPSIQLAASPARVLLVNSGTTTVEVTNGSGRAVEVAAAPLDYDIGRNGRVVVAPRKQPVGSARTWLQVSPSQAEIPPGHSAEFRLTATVPAGQAVGDHHALLAFTTQPVGTGRIGIRTRLGVSVVVRVPGALRRRMSITKARIRGRWLRIGVRNSGNVIERFPPSRIAVQLRRGASARLVRSRALILLPGREGMAAVRLPRSARGRYRAIVRLTPARADPGTPSAHSVARHFTIRLRPAARR